MSEHDSYARHVTDNQNIFNLKTKDLELFNHALNNSSINPDIAFRGFFEGYEMIWNSEQLISDKISKTSGNLFFLGSSLKKYFIALGALNNNLETIKSACEIFGRIKLLSHILEKIPEERSFPFHDLFYSILANDNKAIEIYTSFFRVCKPSYFIGIAIHEIISRKKINKLKNDEILKKFNKKGHSKWGLAVNNLIKAVLTNDEIEYQKQAHEALRLHRRVATSNTWYVEIPIPIKSLGYISVGRFNKNFAPIDLSNNKTFAINNLNDFIKSDPNSIILELIKNRDLNLYSALYNIKTDIKANEIIDWNNLNNTSMSEKKSKIFNPSIFDLIKNVFTNQKKN